MESIESVAFVIVYFSSVNNKASDSSWKLYSELFVFEINFIADQ